MNLFTHDSVSDSESTTDPGRESMVSSTKGPRKGFGHLPTRDLFGSCFKTRSSMEHVAALVQYCPSPGSSSLKHGSCQNKFRFATIRIGLCDKFIPCLLYLISQASQLQHNQTTEWIPLHQSLQGVRRFPNLHGAFCFRLSTCPCRCGSVEERGD